MPVNLSIKNVPDEIAEELRERAARNHRSLQGELMAIIEEAAGRRSPLSPSEFLAGGGVLLGCALRLNHGRWSEMTEMPVKVVEASALGALVSGG